jgi:hypothetical protein
VTLPGMLRGKDPPCGWNGESLRVLRPSRRPLLLGELPPRAVRRVQSQRTFQSTTGVKECKEGAFGWSLALGQGGIVLATAGAVPSSTLSSIDMVQEKKHEKP